MMRPPPWAIITAATARQPRNAPRRWTFIMRSQSATDISVIACGFWMPALLTNTSIRPKCLACRRHHRLYRGLLRDFDVDEQTPPALGGDLVCHELGLGLMAVVGDGQRPRPRRRRRGPRRGRSRYSLR